MPSKAPRALRIFQIVLWSAVAAASAFLILPGFLDNNSTPASTEAAGISGPVTTLGPGVALNAPFTLVNGDGQPVTEAAFAGKPSAWFYGFTNCPDVCPTALAEMAALLEQLGPDASKLNAVFVTVDPERDTQQVMKSYVEYFDPRIIGLTGTLEQVSSMAKSRFVSFEKIPRDDGDYAMQHPASIYLVDAAGNFVGTLDSKESMSVKLGKLQKLVGA